MTRDELREERERMAAEREAQRWPYDYSEEPRSGGPVLYRVRCEQGTCDRYLRRGPCFHIHENARTNVRERDEVFRCGPHHIIEYRAEPGKGGAL